MLLLYILWDDWPIFMISGSNEQLQQQLEYTLLKPDCKRPALFKSAQWHFHQDNESVHNSIFVTDYLTKLGINTDPQPPYSPDFAPCEFWLFSKLRGCRYETIEEMKEAVMNFIDTLAQEDLHGAFQKLLGRYNKCIAAGGDYFKGD